MAQEPPAVARTTARGNAICPGGHRTDSIRRTRLQHLVQPLHQLGPRVLFELLVELGRDQDLRDEIETLVDRYVTRLDPDMLRVTGGDRFAPAPQWALSVSVGTSS